MWDEKEDSDLSDIASLISMFMVALMWMLLMVYICLLPTAHWLSNPLGKDWILNWNNCK